MKKPILIGLHGRAKTGKDTVAKYLADIAGSDGFRSLAFADPLKTGAAAIFGVPLQNFYDETLKELPFDHWDMSPREMIQRLGTDACRGTFGDEIWVTRLNPVLQSSLAAGINVVVTDVRYANEADLIYRSGGVIWHLRRESAQKVRAHSSENGLPVLDGDCVIDNNGTIEDLWHTIRDALALMNI